MYNDEINLLRNVYVINLEQSKERLNKISNNLKKYNISFKRFNAIYGKFLSKNDIDKSISPLCQTVTCSKGFIGASLSHITLWRKALYDNQEWTLILEDDVECTHNTREQLQHIQWYINNYIDITQPTIINLSPYNLFEPDDIDLKPVSYLSGISAYIVNKSALRILVDYYAIHKLKFIIDLDMSMIPGINKYSTSVQIFTTSFDINEAINKTANYSIPLFQSLIQYTLNNNEFSQKLNFIINSSGIHLFMKYTIMNGWVILLILGIIGMSLNSYVIKVYVLIEIFLNFFQIVLAQY